MAFIDPIAYLDKIQIKKIAPQPNIRLEKILVVSFIVRSIGFFH